MYAHVCRKMRLLHLFILFAWLRFSLAHELVASQTHSIAVIGAGIGGSVAAYYMRQELGNDTLIDV